MVAVFSRETVTVLTVDDDVGLSVNVVELLQSHGEQAHRIGTATKGLAAIR
jgi:hypothetical protein